MSNSDTQTVIQLVRASPIIKPSSADKCTNIEIKNSILVEFWSPIINDVPKKYVSVIFKYRPSVFIGNNENITNAICYHIQNNSIRVLKTILVSLFNKIKKCPKSLSVTDDDCKIIAMFLVIQICSYKIKSSDSLKNNIENSCLLIDNIKNELKTITIETIIDLFN